MGLAFLPIRVNVQMAGLEPTVAFQCVSKRVYTMATALIQTHALVREDGLDTIVRLPCALRIVTMEIAWHQILANVSNGRMSGEMDEVLVGFHCTRSRTETHK